MAIKMVVHYFYHLDYPALATSSADQSLALRTSQIQSFGSFSNGSSRSPFAYPAGPSGTGSPEGTTDPKLPSNLVVHAKVYAVAEKYNLSDLKTLAMEKFQDEVKGRWDSDDFILAAQEVYTSTVEHDRSLRDVVVRTMSEHLCLLDKKAVQDMVKSSDLAFDLLMHSRMNHLSARK